MAGRQDKLRIGDLQHGRDVQYYLLGYVTAYRFSSIRLKEPLPLHILARTVSSVCFPHAHSIDLGHEADFILLNIGRTV